MSGCRSKKQVVTPIQEETVLISTHGMSKEEKKLMKEAETWMGTPYAYAKSEKGKGSDCSGFVMMVYLNALDMKLPRNSAKQAEFCKKIDKKHIRPGDLVFFATGKDPHKISHVGMMIDSDRFIHASSSKGVVISSLSSNYYSTHFRRFGRVPHMDNR